MKKSTLLLGIIFIVLGCTRSKPGILIQVSSDPPPKATVSLPALESSFSLELETINWSPAIIGSTTISGIVPALQSKKSIMIISGKGFSKSDDDRIFQMVKNSSPETTIVARQEGILYNILKEKGEVPFRQTIEIAGADVLGRPVFIPKDHPLTTDWLNKKSLLKGAQAILIIDYVTPEDEYLQNMRKQTRGGCQELMDTLHLKTAQSAQVSKDLAETVNNVLTRNFHIELNEHLKIWKAQINNSLTQTQNNDNIRCLQLYTNFLGHYEKCRIDSCPMAPAFYYQHGGLTGIDLSHSSVIPTTCKTKNQVDYVKEIEDLSRKVALSTLLDITPDWINESVRTHRLIELESLLKDTCAPSRRRYSSTHLNKAQEDLLEYLEFLNSKAKDAHFAQTQGLVNLPGTGPVTLLALPSGNNSHMRHLQKIKESMKNLSKCRQSKDRIILVTLVDVKTSEILFSTQDFEEQLFCKDMAPGIP